MRMTHALAGLAIAMWAGSVQMFTIGLTAVDHDELDFYAIGSLFGLWAMTCTGSAFGLWIVERLWRRIHDDLGNSVAEALAALLEEQLAVQTSEAANVTPMR